MCAWGLIGCRGVHYGKRMSAKIWKNKGGGCGGGGGLAGLAHLNSKGLWVPSL